MIFYMNMTTRNFALFILMKTSLIVSNEYQNTLCHKKLKVMMEHFTENSTVWIALKLYS